MGIKTTFTIHNIHRELTTLSETDRHGINLSHFWDLLHYDGYPYSCPGPEAVSGDAAGFSSEAAESEDAPVAMFAVGAGDVLVGEADDFGEFGV